MRGLKHRTVSHSFLDPEFVANLTVEDKHQHQRKEEEDDKNEGCVDSLVHGAGPFLQAAEVFFFI